MTPLVVVTATARPGLFEEFAESLWEKARDRHVPIVVVAQTDAEMALTNGAVLHANNYLGVVPAFARGVQFAIQAYNPQIVACLHDDVWIEEPNWDEQLVAHFETHTECGLAGFGGAWGLGDEQAGKGEYRPTWLVRRGFMSNMRDAEVHGARVLSPRRVAVLDGFSLVFRTRMLGGLPNSHVRAEVFHPPLWQRGLTLFGLLEQWGVVHHAYDAAMGAFARQLGWETWLLPFACHHLGGQTAVGDARYQAWARLQKSGLTEGQCGDSGFWHDAHRIVWTKLGHLLPFEVDRP